MPGCRSVQVTENHQVTFHIVRVPIETPLSIMDGCALDCQMEGKTYRMFCDSGPNPIEAMDLETGEIVELDFLYKGHDDV